MRENKWLIPLVSVKTIQMVEDNLKISRADPFGSSPNLETHTAHQAHCMPSNTHTKPSH
jgi:hypothetical protein